MFSSPGGSSSFHNSLLNVSSRRSLHNTSRTTPSVASRSQRAGEAIKETAHHVVKAINSPVPVQAQEALRGDVSHISVRLHDSGWAWLVCGRSRRLLLWRYGPEETGARCYQLQLPFHSSVWNADLVTVCGRVSTSSVGLLAASPDGHLHYWDNALRERSAPSSNGTAVGSGHVIVSRPVLCESRVILLTSGGTLILVQLPSSSSQSSLSSRSLHTPQGLLSGFGKRVSSLFFGSSGGEQEVEGISLAVRDGQHGTCQVFVLLKSTMLLLQKWIVDDSKEQMVCDWSLEPLIGDGVLQDNWFDNSHSVSLKVWAVDLALTQESLVALFAVGREDDSVVEYGLALFDADWDSAPSATDGLIRLNHKLSIQGEGGEGVLYSLSLACSPSSPSITVLHKNNLFLSIATAEGVATDVVHFPSLTSLLGKGVLDGNVVLFTTVHGIISIKVTSPLPPPPRSSTTDTHSQSQTSVLGGLPSSSTYSSYSSSSSTSHSKSPSSDLVAKAAEQLKDAFLAYLEGNITEATASAHQLFTTHDPYTSISVGGGGDDPVISGCDSLGDIATATLSEMVLNDLPAQDARWGESRESLTNGSVIILYQLENKQTAHLRLIHFLRDCGLLKKLSFVTVRDQPMKTCDLLCEHSEKIVAAIALRRTHNQVVDQAMKMCIDQKASVLLRPGLTHQDVFYTEVVKVDTIISSLVSLLDSRTPSLSNDKEKLRMVLSACGPVEAMLREAVRYRQTKKTLFSPPLPPDPSSLPPFCPWTASLGSSGVRSYLSQLLGLLYEAAIGGAGNQQEVEEVWSVAAGMCDVLLGGYLDQIHSIEHSPGRDVELTRLRKHFESARKRFLSPLLEQGEYDKSVELAEKYQDFSLLVQLCESAGDRERLKSYVAQFAEQGFAEFLFKCHLDKGHYVELLSYSEDFPEQLAKFLEPHDHLSWLHHITTLDYPKAHKALLRLAEKEDECVAKKKTHLSLGKLGLLAAGPEAEPEEMDQLNRELSVIKYQMNIPDDVMEDLGLDMGAMAPLSPEAIVELYVGEKNVRADENDYLRALELLLIVYNEKQRKSEEFTELRTYIWSQAALRDNWSQMSTDNPLDQLPATFLFRVIQRAFYKGFDLGSVLPTLEQLLKSPSLVETGVAKTTQFRFLVSAGFEQLERLQQSSEAEEQEEEDTVA